MERTQKDEVLKHLQKYGSITSLEAFDRYGITRLSAVIYKLKKEHKITSEALVTRNRYGHIVQYARYKLEAEE